MKRMNGRALTLSCVVLLSAIIATTFIEKRQNVSAQKNDDSVPAEQWVPGRILVKFHDQTLPAHARNIIAALGARDAEEIPNIGVHVLDLPYQASETAALRAFQARPEVEFAELDRILEPADMTPNDPWYANWEGHLRRIEAPAAWSTTTGSSAVIVAVLDTGLDGSHEDLASKTVSGWNTFNNNSNSSDVAGHGTAVAGTVAAASNNGLGVASVCWDCRIMPIRVSDTNGSATYSAIANGLNWAADHGARVANISYIVSDSSTVTSAAKYFQDKGGVVTSSAGNYSTFSSAADNPYILTVSATDQFDVIYSYSNTGNNIDLAAPGDSFSTQMGGGYVSVGGTSYSSPIVAGVAALVISANPSLSPTQVQDILKQSADDLGAAGWDQSYGWGRVNAARAVAIAVGAPLPTPTPSPTSSPTPSPTPAPDISPPNVTITSPANGAKVSVNTSVYVTASDNLTVAKVELYVDGKLTATSTSAPFTTKWNTRKATAGSHSLQCKAYDASGNVGSSQIVSVFK